MRNYRILKHEGPKARLHEPAPDCPHWLDAKGADHAWVARSYHVRPFTKKEAATRLRCKACLG